MDFPTPTSMAEVMSTLADIFFFYRHNPLVYEGFDLKELKLNRLEYTLPTDEEFTSLATTLLSATHYREIADKKSGYLSELSVLNNNLASLSKKAEKLISEANLSCDKAIDSVKEDAIKRGIEYSTIPNEKIASIVSENKTLLADINSQIEGEKLSLQSKISALQTLIDGVEDYYRPIHEKEIAAKAYELKTKALEVDREVFKYNNSLDQKEQEYANNLIKTNANLEIKYLEIRINPYSKDELIAMGYYTDCLICVTSYLDTLPYLLAYEKITETGELAVYLDEYYQDLVYMYKVKSHPGDY